MGRIKNLTGQRFGRLVVLGQDDYYTDKSGRRYVMWKCQCDCGNITSVRTGSLNCGETKSCGCYAKSIKKENSVKTNKKVRRLYTIWLGMKQRCYRKDCKAYKWYGERGIIVCDEWVHDFRCFEKWAYDNGYKEGLSIERKDPNGNYEPSNCEWIELSAQQNNKRNTVRIKIGGKYFTINELSKMYGINRNTLYFRYSNGASQEELLKPPRTARESLSKASEKLHEEAIRVTVGNETHTIYEWSEICNIKPSTLYNRFITGKTGESFIAKPRKKARTRKN